MVNGEGHSLRGARGQATTRRRSQRKSSSPQILFPVPLHALEEPGTRRHDSPTAHRSGGL